MNDHNRADGGEGTSGVVRLDAELTVISLDQTAGALLQAAPEELVGRSLEGVLGLGNLANLMKSGVSFRNQTVQGGGGRLACDFLPLTLDGRIVGGVLSLLQAPAAGPADHLKELLRSAGEFLNLDYDGIVVVDRNGKVVLVNEAFAEVLGTTPQAMIGKHVYQAYPNSQPSHLPSVMESGKPEIGITHYLNGKQVCASLFPIIKAGEVIGGLGKILFKDIREIALLANRLHSRPQGAAPSRSQAGNRALFRYEVDSIVGQSGKMVKLKEDLLRVAQKNSNVLLLGESGTGKELFAHAIHAASKRRYAPFVKVNCAAIPEHLLESELFGYAEGAFTGAKRGGQSGKFEQAHTGTIFLDEIGDMPLYMQAKMLRVLQERELTPLGSGNPKLIDVRVVAATNSNLEQLVRDGKFREDLYYRLKVVTFHIPSLRERMSDVHPLVDTFLQQFNAEFELQVVGLDQEAWEIVQRYDWPGNIRELRNVIESAFNSVTGTIIRREDLPEQLSQLVPRPPTHESLFPSAEPVSDYIRGRLGRMNLDRIIEEFENLLIDAALELNDGNKARSAEMLGISRQWLHKKLQRHGTRGGDQD